MTRIHRAGLLASSILFGVGAAFGVGVAASAQDEEGREVIVITGSRIQRANLTGPTPVQVIDELKLEGQGLENVTDILTSMPQFAAAFGTARTQSTFSGQVSSGLNLVNLRNLDPTRSLTLINGRRAPAGEIDTTAVDFNMLPSANIARIEVLTAGASAIYGADAVAGVVNIITDDSFEGIEFGASYGESFETNDNINPSAFVRFGTALGDRGHGTATLQYDYQGLVMCADRALCEDDFFWFYPDPPIQGPGARSGVPLTGRFFVDGAPGSYTYVNGDIVPFVVADHGYNRNARRTLAIPTERIMFAAEADYEVFSGVNAFLEFNYGSTETEAPFEAHPFQSSSDTLPGDVEPSIPVDNPFIPQELLDLAILNGDDEITWWHRFEGLGDRGATNLRQMSRFVVGLEGDFESIAGFGSNWSWETSYTAGRTTLESDADGLVSIDSLYEGLRVVESSPGVYECANPLAVAAGCVPINPFDGYDDAEDAYLVRRAGAIGRHELESGLATLSGDLVELPAGPLQAAVGVESRRTTAFIDYDTDINLGLTSGNQIGDNERTTISTDEAFVELVVPVLADLPFAESVNLEGAYRFSSPNRFDDYETWKFGGDWMPVSGVRLRAMQNRAIRAPNLEELTGISETFGNVDDPCANWGANPDTAVQTNCAAEGIPPDYDPPLVVLQNVGGFEGGNPDLEPEVADTLTYGVVLTAGDMPGVPDLLSGFTLSFDRFEIEIEDLINTIGRGNILALCYSLPAGQRELYCSSITRGTDPAVPGANYVLTDIDDTLQNIALLEIAGYDLQVGYEVEIADLFGGSSDWGSLAINSSWTFYDKADYTPLPGEDPLDFLGAAGGTTSDQGWLEMQGTTQLNWSIGPWSSTLTTRYIGEADSAPADIFGADSVTTIDAEIYNDVQVRYALNDMFEVYGGVNNVGDVDPPFFPFSQAGTQALDTVPAYYDVFGRSWYVGFKGRF